MTPLEEIEHTIERLRTFEPGSIQQIELLTQLYQARAIERLEATVRAIGVFIQRVYEEAKAE